MASSCHPRKMLFRKGRASEGAGARPLHPHAAPTACGQLRLTACLKDGQPAEAECYHQTPLMPAESPPLALGDIPLPPPQCATATSKSVHHGVGDGPPHPLTPAPP